VSAGWVAGSVRARLLTRRRLGRAGARAVAAAGGTDAAVALLADSPYGRDVRAGMPADAARRAVGSVCLWHLRVLAGWLPPHGGEVVRVFAGRFELANIADSLVAMTGRQVPEPYTLGALGVAWPRVAAASTGQEVRAALAGSAWGDPGTATWPDAAVPLEARWAGWLADAIVDAPVWATGAAALVVARQLAVARPVPQAAMADLRRQLGRNWESATDLPGLAARLPRRGTWVLDGVDSPEGLWRAEGRWWQRVDGDAAATLRGARPGPDVAAAAAARLVVDVWRAQAALEAAPWGRTGVGTFDALACGSGAPAHGPDRGRGTGDTVAPDHRRGRRQRRRGAGSCRPRRRSVVPCCGISAPSGPARG
jgi:hypothetical protein